MDTKSLKVLFVESFNQSVNKGDAITLNDVIVLCSLARMCDESNLDLDGISGRSKPDVPATKAIYDMLKIVAQKLLDGCVLDELEIDQITEIEALINQVNFKKLGLFLNETGLIRVIKSTSLLFHVESRTVSA